MSKDHRPITWEQFEEAIKEVFVKDVPPPPPYEAKKPSQEELEAKWRLVKETGA